MPTDVVPALQEGIEASFRARMASDRRVRSVTKRIRDGTATFIDGRQYAEGAGRALAGALQENLAQDLLPNGRLYYNIANRTVTPALRNNYELVNEVAAQIQEIEDAALGIGLQATRAEFPEERVAGLIDMMTAEDIDFSRVLYWIGEPIVNNSEAFMDDFVRSNAEFRQKSGLSAKISRIVSPGCCEWCEKTAGRGTYDYGEQPDDFFRRHEFCRCSVTYQTGRTTTNVWSKKTWESTPQELARRKATGLTARSGLSSEEYDAVMEQLQRDKRIRRYMQETGYTRRTAQHSTIGMTDEQITQRIAQAKDWQRRQRARRHILAREAERG